jgi:deoxyribodipyrimidine photolyase-related protein
MAKRLIYLAHDNLHRLHGALREASPESEEIVMVESQRMLTSARWHRQRLFFMLSAARHFAQDLRNEGFTLHYLKAPTTATGIAQLQDSFSSVIGVEPSSYRLSKSLREIGLTLIENDFFLTSRSVFSSWAESQKLLKMENFYRWQRARLNLLMDEAEPLGGQWNYDAENRLPPPKGEYLWPQYPKFERDEIDQEIIEEIGELNLIGEISEMSWGTTRTAALQQLDTFLTHSFAKFGPYEDAMPKDQWQVYHSLLSPYLNIGLLHPREVVEAAIKRFESGDIPIASCEGFIRQIIGWREYIHGIYWHFGEDYRRKNYLGSKRELLPLFENSEKTKMACVKTQIRDIDQRGWVHHIPRLMILSNLAALADVKPEDFLAWMRRVFIDAADWVMVPNVIGMSMYADGGMMSTKPYISGGAYISRMSNFCKDCQFDPKLRVGEDACPFTTLYWNYLSKHQALFAKNHRMFQQLNGLKKLKDLPETLERAQEVLSKLENGEI